MTFLIAYLRYRIAKNVALLVISIALFTVQELPAQTVNKPADIEERSKDIYASVPNQFKESWQELISALDNNGALEKVNSLYVLLETQANENGVHHSEEIEDLEIEKFRVILSNLIDDLLESGYVKEGLSVFLYFENVVGIKNLYDQQSLKASYYSQIGEYNKSLQIYLDLVGQISAKQNDTLAYLYNNIGNIHLHNENYQLAIKHYLKSLESAKNSEDAGIQILAKGNLGIAYRRVGESEKAVALYRSSLQMAIEESDTLQIARNYLNYGNALKDNMQLDSALYAYQNSLDICEKYGIPYGIAVSMLNISELHIKRKEFDRALAQLKSSEKLVLDMGNPKITQGLYKNYFDLYTALKNDPEALRYKKLLDQLEHEMQDEEKQREVKLSQLAFDLEQLERNYVKAQENLVKVENNLINTHSTYRTYIIVGSISVLLLFSLVFYFYQKQRRTKLSFQKSLIALEEASAAAINDKDQTSSPKLEDEQSPNHRLDFLKNIPEAHTSVSQNASEQNDGVPLQYREIFDQITTLLEEEKVYLNPHLSISDFTERIGTNRRYVSEAVNQCSNMNFMNLINSYRIKYACNLIIETAMPIKQIMLESGFSSESTFFRAFKTITGITPKEFATQAKKLNS
jgi:AraC-like DNA-binding protein